MLACQCQQDMCAKNEQEAGPGLGRQIDKKLTYLWGDDDGWENPWKIKIAKGHPARFSLEEKTH